MSTRIILSSLPNTLSASALASSVLPTPVGPRNMKEPIGRRLSATPERARRMALETAEIASSCPTTRLCNSFSRLIKRSLSDLVICVIGTPVSVEATATTA